jgi:hypothetical protein
VTVEPLFAAAGDAWIATEWSRGPWDPNALHGGPPAALLARAAETIAGTGLAPSRMTVELLRPVPAEPLIATAVLARPGRTVQLVDARLTLASTGVDVAWARVLFIRSAAVALPTDDPRLAPLLVAEPSPPGPDGLARVDPGIDGPRPAFHRDATELRFVAGAGLPGPVTFWGRLLAPVVPGEEPSPLQRTVALADMGNGVSAVVGFDTHTFINPELSVHLARLPQGEWLGMRSRTLYGTAGAGLAESELFDTAGRMGRAVQSLVMDAR